MSVKLQHQVSDYSCGLVDGRVTGDKVITCDVVCRVCTRPSSTTLRLSILTSRIYNRSKRTTRIDATQDGASDTLSVAGQSDSQIRDQDETLCACFTRPDATSVPFEAKRQMNTTKHDSQYKGIFQTSCIHIGP